MILDLVHDTQQAYRQLMHAFAHPGKVLQILAADRVSQLAAEGFTPTELLSLIMLDGDVSAFFTGFDTSKVQFIARLTAMRQTPCAEADFLFFAGASVQLRDARIGTHRDPHLGATAFIFFESFPFTPNAKSEGVGAVTLEGPGILGQRCIGVKHDSGEALWWVAPRNHCVAEFPLGIDVVVYSRDGELLAIPRATKIKFDTAVSAGDRGDR